MIPSVVGGFATVVAGTTGSVVGVVVSSVFITRTDDSGGVSVVESTFSVFLTE